jgi:hypothetical protein
MPIHRRSRGLLVASALAAAVALALLAAQDHEDAVPAPVTPERRRVLVR